MTVVTETTPMRWWERIRWQLALVLLLGGGIGVVLALAFADIAVNMLLVRTALHTAERQVVLMVQMTADRAEQFSRFAPTARTPPRPAPPPPQPGAPGPPPRERRGPGVRTRTVCAMPDGSTEERIFPPDGPFAIPSWLTAEQFSGVVYGDGNPSIRAYHRTEQNGCRIEVLASTPVDEHTARLIGEAAELRVEAAPPPPLLGAAGASQKDGSFKKGRPSLPQIAWSNLLGEFPNGIPAAVQGYRWSDGEHTYGPLLRVWPNPDTMWRQLTSLGEQQRRWIWALGFIAGALLLVELIAVWLAVRLARRIVRSVNLLSEATDQIAAGNLDHRIPVKRNDQLGRLGQAFNRMAASIGQLIEEARENERLEEEVRVARQMQESMLPDRLPYFEKARLAAACFPARNVSGDLYDVIQLDKDRIGVLCADVSGKGIPAALMMSNVQAMVRTLVEGRNGDTPSPAALVKRLNQEVCRHSPSNTFVTLFWADYDAVLRRLRWANAGHCPAYLMANGTEQWLSEGGLPVGMFPTAEYVDQERTLPPGATLITYTDGVVEAERSDGEAFGEDGLVAVCRAHASQGPDELVRAVVDSVRAWTGGRDPGDDLTLVVMQGL